MPSAEMVAAGAGVAGVVLDGFNMAFDLGRWTCENRAEPEAKRLDRLSGVHIPPLHSWSDMQLTGEFVLSFGSDSIHGSKHGIPR
jgi:hypothetical protein